MKRATISNIVTGMLFGFIITGVLAFKENKNSNETIPTYTSPALPENLSFADEKVPLERWDVKERLDREILFNYYNQANILFLLKLANRYFPVISERLKANGIPDDFKYLCVAESNLLSNARSRVGATGFWQFMAGTAPGYGLETNSQVDHRYDVEKSTDAASKYLLVAYQKFGTWTGAAASYNCGQGGYNSHATYQGSKNYYDLLLPDETNRYIFRILAFKYLMENAEKLGFHLKQDELYPLMPFRTVTINSSIPNLATYAIANGTNYKMLRQMNPWVRGKTLSVKSGKSYELKLPAQ
ncbi:MAG: lytic transglycosylase domain-containing protein [Chitinophagaceae bacterium]